MRENIIVLHARDTGKALKAVAGKDFAWLYLGQDITQRQNIAVKLGEEKRYFTGSLLQDTAYEQKKRFLDFLAALGQKQDNQLYWWASDTAYRNPLTSDLFLLWCYASLFGKVIDKEKWGEKKSLIVFVEERWLYKALRQRGGSGDYRFLSAATVWPEALKLTLKLIAARFLFIGQACRPYIGARRLKPRNEPGYAGDTANRVYIYSWIQDRSFNERGEFRDAYFGRLPDIVTEGGNQISYITPPFLPRPLKQKCQDVRGLDFTFLDNYYTFINILRSACACLRIDYRGEEKWVGTLLRRQNLHEIFFPRHPAYYHAFKKWLKQSVGDNAVIIYPFENQPWEKMLCRAVRESGKKIRLIAYQHTTVPSMVLNYFLGEGEASGMPLPDCIVADSDRALKTMKNAGFGGVEIVNGGALRFEHLLSRKSDIREKERKQSKNVLVALPYQTDLVQEFLLAVFNAFEGLKDSPGILIKFHPSASAKNLRIRLPDWPPHFESTEKPISEMLGEIDLVICSSANIILEMALTGIPVVSYRSEHILCLDELEGLDEGAVKSCYENDMQNVVLSVLNRGVTYSPGDASRKVTGFFAPVNEEVWKDVVKFK